jgi:cyclic pyranopterin phosphate synthase
VSDKGKLDFDMQVADSYGRILHKLRVSVTDRCNLRCEFCMPKSPTWLPPDEILTYEEMLRVIKTCAAMGVQKIRLSGGEPLMRRDLDRFVRMLRGIPGISFIGMTTNGLMLPEKAAALKEAGLDSVTISLHSLKPDRFRTITGGGKLEDVMAGIQAAIENGFRPIKINSVIMRGFNDDEILDLASLAFSNDLTVRFIEFMPFDGKQSWEMDKVVSGDEIVEIIRKRYRILSLPREASSTARVYKFVHGKGEVGIITSVTEPFCSDCERIRLSANGRIFTCLFDSLSYDLKPLLRGGAPDGALSDFIRDAVSRKPPGVQALLKHCNTLEHVRAMYTIGG